MLRAGLIRMLSAGVYSYLPLGWSSMLKTIGIIREEMNLIGGQEILLPSLTPEEIWKETGRNEDFGDEMFRLKDRKGHTECLAPTHEEIICSIARGNIRSWRELPQIWYQIQTKFRDEPRPRGGVLRCRQFLMKDSYSMERDEGGLDKSYHLHKSAYERIFKRCGLNYFIVGASSGLMGGASSQEFMVESDAGEDEVAICDESGYAANIEVARSIPDPVSQGEPQTLRDVHTPNKRTVEEVSEFLNVPKSRMVKTLIYMSENSPIMVLISGEDELSEGKLLSTIGNIVRSAEPVEVLTYMGADIGFLGPHGKKRMPIYADLRLKNTKGMISGANKNDYHVLGLELGRDIHPDQFVDLRTVREGEKCHISKNGGILRIVRAIELGHIFKLGTKYSSAMGATFLDEKGNDNPIIMGSYGIGVERIIAASIENHSDKDGIRWNSTIAPVDCVVIPFGEEKPVVDLSESLYSGLRNSGISTILDNRSARAGVKMKDADLTGIPAHVIISPRNLKNNQVEIKNRWSGDRTFVNPGQVEETIKEILRDTLPK